MKRNHFLYILLVVLLCILPFKAIVQQKAIGLFQRIKGKKSIQQRLDEFSEVVQKRLSPYFEEQKVKYPPEKIIIVGLKSESRLEVWASSSDNKFKLIRSYPILAASGKIGPKLKEGDQQVPEGIYRIESINPNSLFHLSLRIDYPNSFDKAMAKKEGRKQLGGDIFIHGNSVSIGCLAMGDETAEDLSILAAVTGLNNIKVVLSPIDFRKGQFTDEKLSGLPDWCKELYSNIRVELNNLKD